ncbi:hypothetical protein IMZ48_29795 [Candidatus Bathyarchaeota archaeon]|nr:hypothetical protein [Candidatus Bathyarchaeota archaeon]
MSPVILDMSTVWKRVVWPGLSPNTAQSDRDALHMDSRVLHSDLTVSGGRGNAGIFGVSHIGKPGFPFGNWRRARPFWGPLLDRRRVLMAGIISFFTLNRTATRPGPISAWCSMMNARPSNLVREGGGSSPGSLSMLLMP